MRVGLAKIAGVNKSLTRFAGACTALPPSGSRVASNRTANTQDRDYPARAASPKAVYPSERLGRELSDFSRP
jgi:hypothetical protein